MPFPLKIQPVDAQSLASPVPADVSKPALASKSRLKRLFERQFTGALRTSSAEKAAADGKERDAASELEPSSLCLAKMVQSFMEAEPNERPPPPPRCGRRRCNCFNGNCDDSSEDELDYADSFLSTAPSGDAADVLKSLVPCTSMEERNLLADTSRIVEKSNKTCCSGRSGNRGSECRKIVADGLIALGHDASVCRSRWDKSPSFPAGEHEYVDVIVGGGERLIVDVDFRSEFEVARSTKSYRAALQTLPAIFVGREGRLGRIVAVVSEAARQSLKKKGLHVPPWRKHEYMLAKWLSPYQRVAPPPPLLEPLSLPAPVEPTGVEETKTGRADNSGGDCSSWNGNDGGGNADSDGLVSSSSKDKKESDVEVVFSLDLNGEFELRYEESGQLAASPPPSPANTPASGVWEGKNEGKGTKEVAARAVAVASSVWQLPAIKPKAPLKKGAKVVTGLASIVRDLN